MVRCLLASMPPGCVIPVHHDTGHWVKHSHRVHVAIVTDVAEVCCGVYVCVCVCFLCVRGRDCLQQMGMRVHWKPRVVSAKIWRTFPLQSCAAGSFDGQTTGEDLGWVFQELTGLTMICPETNSPPFSAHSGRRATVRFPPLVFTPISTATVDPPRWTFSWGRIRST